MTKRQALAWVASHTDEEALDEEELEEVFQALYDRKADAQDHEEGLWSHCCSYVA